jgi:2-methylcitrate dehydratase
VRRLELRTLDTLGCVIGALGGEPPRAVGRQIDEFAEGGRCARIGGGGGRRRRTGRHYGTGRCFRSLDFMDSYLAP